MIRSSKRKYISYNLISTTQETRDDIEIEIGCCPFGHIGESDDKDQEISTPQESHDDIEIETGCCPFEHIGESDDKDQDDNLMESLIPFYCTLLTWMSYTIMSSLFFIFEIEKERIWTRGHILSTSTEVAEFVFFLSFFLSLTGLIASIKSQDFVWIVPGSIAFMISFSLICLPYILSS